ncbi:MAG: M28 family peptidase [Candidatus Cloacimonetes bacterium]|nr:M28 family peptidase [Candidatus Cloacimonadota bacterium]
MDLYKILKQIDYERLTGSAGEKKARTVFKGYLSSWGLSFTEHEFDLHTFETGSSEVIVSTASLLLKSEVFKASLPEKTNPFTAFKALPLGLVKTSEVKGELFFMENCEQIFCQKGMFKGKIILTNTRSPKLADRLKEEEVAGIVYISQPYKELMATNLRQKSYEEGAVPAVYVSYEDAREISKLCGEEITIKIDQKVKKKKGTNLIVDIPGTGLDKTLTCICAHYDSVATSAGTCDNGAGSVIILKIAEYFSKNPPLRDLRIIFFSGEEMGLLGSWAYTNDFKEELKKRVGLLINVDVSGDDLGVDSFDTIGSNEILGYVDGVFKEEGLVFKKKIDIYSSDGIPFSAIEIPSINLQRWGGSSSFHIHTCNDTVEKITQRGLETTFNATKILCERLLNAKIYPVKPAIDQSLKDKIEEYIFMSTKQEPKLDWKKKYDK